MRVRTLTAIACSSVLALTGAVTGSSGRAGGASTPRYELLKLRQGVWTMVASGGWVATIIEGGRAGSSSACDYVLAWSPLRGITRRVAFSAAKCRKVRDSSLADWDGLSFRGTKLTWYAGGGECSNEVPCSVAEPNPYAADIRRPRRITRITWKERLPERSLRDETRNGVELKYTYKMLILRRISDGRMRLIRAPRPAMYGSINDADLDETGLFYAYDTSRGDYEGRIIYFSYDELFP